MSTRTIHLAILGPTFALALACGGLPDMVTGDVDLDDDVVARDDAADEVVDDEPLPEPGELFSEIEGDGAAWQRAPSCPSGTSMVKNPRGGAIEVFCMTHSGTREGPWSRWKGSRLLETKTYSAGQLEGPAERYEDGRRIELVTYSAGEQTGDYAAWDVEGNLLVRGTTVGGDKQGLFIEMGADGAFGGACYAAGVETWRTDDAEVFVTRACDDDGSAEVASLE